MNMTAVTGVIMPADAAAAELTDSDHHRGGDHHDVGHALQDPTMHTSVGVCVTD
jgi:hypothetical protein